MTGRRTRVRRRSSPPPSPPYRPDRPAPARGDAAARACLRASADKCGRPELYGSEAGGERSGNHCERNGQGRGSVRLLLIRSLKIREATLLDKLSRSWLTV